MSRVPFAFDLADGLVSVRGVAYLDGDVLVVRTSRRVLGLVPIGSRTLRLPAAEIANIGLETRVMRARLVVQPFSAEDLAGFPGDPGDQLSLPVARKHRAAA